MNIWHPAYLGKPIPYFKKVLTERKGLQNYVRSSSSACTRTNKKVKKIRGLGMHKYIKGSSLKTQGEGQLH